MTFLAAIAGLLTASPPTVSASQQPDCPADQVTNGFVSPDFDDEMYPGCIEFIIADGPERLYGVELPDAYWMRPIEDGGAVAPDTTRVVYAVDRPEGDPLGPWIIAVTIERQTRHGLPAGAPEHLPADFLPVPGVWGESRAAATATARWIEPSGLYTLTIHTDVVDLSLEEVAARLIILDPVPPATGSGLAEQGSSATVAPGSLTVVAGAVMMALLLLHLRKRRRRMAH